jgi:hypothetical protein
MYGNRLTEALDGDGTKMVSLLLPPSGGSVSVSWSNDMSRLVVTCLDSLRHRTNPSSDCGRPGGY